ncbi:serine endopeptidase [Massilia horti]|uniref:Serine endopeptidase n=1 Tax=Massilia horti TaxID=2562153 RepID=A0A4Y9SRY4_9BURK|nr:serine endopeptidase [Massilia horti]TFW29552.1 serine endopeptidase [Massilia horti]
MANGLRRTEQWMRFFLWLVAFAFAAFLIGLGGKIVDNLWAVEAEPSMEQFIDTAKAEPLRQALADAEKTREEARERLAKATQKHQEAESDTAAARETFDNWVATRRVTARPDQDAELIERTRKLDALKAAERAALATVQAERAKELDARHAFDHARGQLDQVETPAYEAANKAAKAKALRVFGYRLALTLPLLVIAGWLFARKRNSSYWPFVWGFILFALVAFFVELVPYLPDFGGYVRYGVGVLVTVVVGRYAIQWLQAYLERQRAAEALPEPQRRGKLRYDEAMARLEHQVCPGCERKANLSNEHLDFCPHCGIGLFDRCNRCSTRKNAFARFCFSCGAPANATLMD